MTFILSFLSWICVVVSIFLLLRLWIQHKFSYWVSRGIQQLNPQFPFGDITLNNSIGEQFMSIYKNFKSKGVKHGGAYVLFRPSYVPIDLEIIKKILVKDFVHFRNHGNVTINEDIDPLAATLFHTQDEKWKNLRNKLTPTFTSGKIKIMFPTIFNCAIKLMLVFDKKSSSAEPVEIKEVLSRFTTDIIGSCAFGIDCNTLENPDSEFLKYGAKVFRAKGLQKLKFIAVRALPSWLVRFLMIKSTDPEVERFFMNVVRETAEYREKNNIFRKDFMHLLLQLRNTGAVDENKKTFKDGNTKGSNDLHISMDELAAQCFAFFTAGFETSASTMTFALYELAKNELIQNKLRKEITDVLENHNHKYTYEAFSKMTYLDQVIKETLRMYPAVSVLPRTCTKDYVVPETNLTIEVGTRVDIPVWGIHMDPEYYPEPETFDPDRFTKENAAKRHAFAWIPFGEGPRICLGMRFGLLEIKIGIAIIIQKFKLTVNKKTSLPFEIATQSVITNVKGGIWFNILNIN